MLQDSVLPSSKCRVLSHNKHVDRKAGWSQTARWLLVQTMSIATEPETPSETVCRDKSYCLQVVMHALRSNRAADHAFSVSYLICVHSVHTSHLFEWTSVGTHSAFTRRDLGQSWLQLVDWQASPFLRSVYHGRDQTPSFVWVHILQRQQEGQWLLVVVWHACQGLSKRQARDLTLPVGGPGDGWVAVCFATDSWRARSVRRLT